MKEKGSIPVIEADPRSIVERRMDTIGAYCKEHELYPVDIRRAHEAALDPTIELDETLFREPVLRLVLLLREYYNDGFPVNRVAELCDGLDRIVASQIEASVREHIEVSDMSDGEKRMFLGLMTQPKPGTLQVHNDRTGRIVKTMVVPEDVQRDPYAKYKMLQNIGRLLSVVDARERDAREQQGTEKGTRYFSFTFVE